MDNQELIALVKSGQCTFAADRGGTCYKAEGLGVRPIITPMRDNLAFFHGCPVADTIIGKAAALLLILSGASFVYGTVMSQAAVQVLENAHIPYQYETLVDYIENRTGTDMCPLEDSVKEEDDPQRALPLIEARIAQLMQNKA